VKVPTGDAVSLVFLEGLVLGILTDCGVAVGGSRTSLPMPNKCLNRTGGRVFLQGCAVVVGSSRARLPVLAMPPRDSVGLVSRWDCGNAAGDPWVRLPVLLLPLDKVGRSDVRKVDESTVEEESTMDGYC
jgi:hypothetical protein